MLRESTGISNHSRDALRFVLWAIDERTRFKSLPRWQARKLLRRVIEAFQSCQDEQARVIDEVFGQLSGRVQSLEAQVLALLAREKENVIDKITTLYSGEDASDDRQRRMRNRLVADLGRELGLSGMSAAAADVDHIDPPLTATEKLDRSNSFAIMFHALEFCESVAADINQQAEDAERFIVLGSLIKWTSPDNAAGNGGFDSHSIFFDNERTDAMLYPGSSL